MKLLESFNLMANKPTTPLMASIDWLRYRRFLTLREIFTLIDQAVSKMKKFQSFLLSQQRMIKLSGELNIDGYLET